MKLHANATVRASACHHPQRAGRVAPRGGSGPRNRVPWWEPLGVGRTDGLPLGLRWVQGVLLIHPSGPDVQRLAEDDRGGIDLGGSPSGIRLLLASDFPCAHPHSGEAGEPETERFSPAPAYLARKSHQGDHPLTPSRPLSGRKGRQSVAGQRDAYRSPGAQDRSVMAPWSEARPIGHLSLSQLSAPGPDPRMTTAAPGRLSPCTAGERGATSRTPLRPGLSGTRLHPRGRGSGPGGARGADPPRGRNQAPRARSAPPGRGGPGG